MDRWTWMMFKAYLPSMYVAGVTFLAWLVTKDIGQNPLLQSLGQIFGWIPVVGFGVALLMASFTTFRMWRWETGRGPSCHSCGGMLGGERDGRASRGGAYRKCLACGMNVNHMHY